MTDVGVAATQMACSWEREENLDRAENLVRQAASGGASLVTDRGVRMITSSWTVRLSNLLISSGVRAWAVQVGDNDVCAGRFP